MPSDTGNGEVERYGWVRASALQEAACLTFVQGADLPRVAEEFGAVRDRGCTLDFDEFCEEAFAHHDEYSVIGVRTAGDWLMVVEDNGFQGSRPEVLRRVSGGTEAVSVFWNANALTRFSYAAGGEVRTSFEALLPEFREGTRPDALEELRADLPWHEGRGADPVALMLALSARITGRALTPELFTGEFETYPVAAWPDDLPRLLDVTDDYPPELVAAVRAADRGGRRRAATAVARRVLERADCLDVPVINHVLASMATEQVDRAAISEAVRQWQWQTSLRRTTSRTRARLRAAEVLRQATNDDPLVAVFAALSAARVVRGVDARELMGVASGALASHQ